MIGICLTYQFYDMSNRGLVVQWLGITMSHFVHVGSLNSPIRGSTMMIMDFIPNQQISSFFFLRDLLAWGDLAARCLMSWAIFRYMFACLTKQRFSLQKQIIWLEEICMYTVQCARFIYRCRPEVKIVLKINKFTLQCELRLRTYHLSSFNNIQCLEPQYDCS